MRSVVPLICNGKAGYLLCDLDLQTKDEKGGFTVLFSSLDRCEASLLLLPSETKPNVSERDF